jgi:hypothetical protein
MGIAHCHKHQVSVGCPELFENRTSFGRPAPEADPRNLEQPYVSFQTHLTQICEFPLGRKEERYGTYRGKVE